MEEKTTGIARSKLRNNVPGGKRIDPDTSTLKLKFAFHLKPQGKPTEFSDEFFEKNLEQEYAIRYLEKIGATPNPKNIAMVRNKMPISSCEKTSAFRCRGWLTDTLYVTTDKDIEEPTNEEGDDGFEGTESGNPNAEKTKTAANDGSPTTKQTTSDGLSMMWDTAAPMARAGAADNIVSNLGGQKAFGQRGRTPKNRPGRRTYYAQNATPNALEGFMKAPGSQTTPFSNFNFRDSDTIKTGVSWNDGIIDARQRFIITEARAGLVKPLEITRDKIEEMQDAFIGSFPFGKFNPKMTHSERDICSDILQMDSVKRIIGLLCHYLYWMHLRPFGQRVRGEGDVLSVSKYQDLPTFVSRPFFDSGNSDLPSARFTQRLEALSAPPGPQQTGRPLNTAGSKRRPQTGVYKIQSGSKLMIKLESPMQSNRNTARSLDGFNLDAGPHIKSQSTYPTLNPSVQLEEFNKKNGMAEHAGLSETEGKRLYAAIQQTYNSIHSQVCKAKSGVLVNMPILMLSIRDAIERIFWASYDYFKVSGEEGRALMAELHANVSELLDPKWYHAKLETDGGLDMMQRTYGTAVKPSKHGNRSLKDTFYTTSSMIQRVYPNPQSAQARGILRSRKLERSSLAPEMTHIPTSHELRSSKFLDSSPPQTPHHPPATDQLYETDETEEKLLSKDRAKIYKEIMMRTNELNRQTYKLTKNRTFLERRKLMKDDSESTKRKEYLKKVHEKHIKNLLKQPQYGTLQRQQWSN